MERYSVLKAFDKDSFSNHAIVALSAKILSYVLGLASAILVSRIIGSAGKGTISISLSLSGILAMLMSLGLGSSITIELRDKPAGIQGFLILAAYYSFAACLLVYLILWLFPVNTLLGLHGQKDILFPSAVAIGGLLLGDISAGVLQGVGEVRLGLWIRFGPGMLQAIACLLLLLSGIVKPIVFVWTVSAVTWIPGLCGWFMSIFLTSNRSGTIRNSGKKIHLGRLVVFSLQNQAIWILLFLNYRLDMLILAALSGSSAVGVYSVSVSFSEVSWLGVNAILSILLPHLNRKDNIERLNLTNLSIRLSSLYTLFSCAVISLSLHLFGTKVFGDEFAKCAIAFVALSPGIVSLCSFKILATFFVAKKQPQGLVIVAACALGINIACNYILVPKYGPVGAGMASGISYSIASIAAVFYYLKRERVRLVDLLPFRLKDAMRILTHAK